MCPGSGAHHNPGCRFTKPASVQPLDIFTIHHFRSITQLIIALFHPWAFVNCDGENWIALVGNEAHQQQEQQQKQRRKANQAPLDSWQRFLVPFRTKRALSGKLNLHGLSFWDCDWCYDMLGFICLNVVFQSFILGQATNRCVRRVRYLVWERRPAIFMSPYATRRLDVIKRKGKHWLRRGNVVNDSYQFILIDIFLAKTNVTSEPSFIVGVFGHH